MRGTHTTQFQEPNLAGLSPYAPFTVNGEGRAPPEGNSEHPSLSLLTVVVL